MGKEQLMLLEIENKRRLPVEVKKTIHTDIFHNLISAVIILVYFCTINLMYYYLSSNTFELFLKYFSLSLILITVILFEISYRKNSIKIMIAGIEILLMGILCLYIPYIFIYMSRQLRLIIMILPGFVVLYYLAKSLIIFIRKKLIYQNNLSDVKEIVKDTERTSYIDEESIKSFKKKIEEEEIIKQVILKEQLLKRQRRYKKTV